MNIYIEIRFITIQSCHFCLSICPCVTAVWTKRLVCPTGDRKNSHKTNRKYRTPNIHPRSATHFLWKYAYTWDPGACYRPPGIKFAFWKHKKRGTKKWRRTIVGSGVTRRGGCSYVIYTASPVYMYTILNVRGN